MTSTPDNLVLFDGLCNLCNSAVQFIIRHDRRAVFRFVAIQSERGRAICNSCGLDRDDIQTLVLLRNGRRYVRSSAALELAAGFGGLWRLAASLKVVPVWARDGLYMIVSKHRYRWFGKRDTCLIPSDDIRRRFLE